MGAKGVNEQGLLLDCLRRLNAGEIAYMLTGSMASNAWGIPRTTHGLDFVIQLPPSQIALFAGAFASADYPRRVLHQSCVPAALPIQFNSHSLGFESRLLVAPAHPIREGNVPTASPRHMVW